VCHCRFFSWPRFYEPGGPAVRINHYDLVASVNWDDPIAIHIAKYMASKAGGDANAHGSSFFMKNLSVRAT
jgi:hypothetical protein